MLTREILSQEHAELDTLVEGILAQISAPTPDHARLGALRWRLNRVLLVHLAKEDKLLYPALARRSPDVAALSKRLAEEMGGLATSFTEYVEDWPIQRAMADWAEFASRTRSILTALRDRIQREEAELYPLMAQA